MGIKIMIALSNMLLSEGIARLLEDEKDIAVTHLLPVGSNPYEKLKTLKPDVILVDFTALYNTFDKCSENKFILFDTCCGDENIVSSVLKKGVKGIILGNSSLPLLKKAIRVVAGGDVWMDKETVKNLVTGVNEFKGNGLSTLSTREREIVSLISRGYTNKEIGQHLFISESTVKSHLYNMFRKLDIQNRPQLIALAYKHANILDLPVSKNGE